MDNSVGYFHLFYLEAFAWELSFENCRDGLSAWDLSLRNVRLGASAWELSLGILRFGHFVCFFSVANFRSSMVTFAWKHQRESFRFGDVVWLGEPDGNQAGSSCGWSQGTLGRQPAGGVLGLNKTSST